MLAMQVVEPTDDRPLRRRRRPTGAAQPRSSARQPDQPLTWPGWEDSIQYAYMDLGETQLMASDVPPQHFQPMRSV
jgi:hypothetical protein